MPDENSFPMQWAENILNAGMRALSTAIELSIARGGVA